MSSFYKELTNPKTGKKQMASCIDGYFGGREYGYAFMKNGEKPNSGFWHEDDYDIFRKEEVYPKVKTKELLEYKFLNEEEFMAYAIKKAVKMTAGKVCEGKNYKITTDIQHIGMLRQYLNERPDPKKLVTNEEILTWLKIK